MRRPPLTLALVGVLSVSLCGQSLPEDPVLKARAQRAQAQGIQPEDLPPVPRTVQEPPPLPAPELHPKELRRSARGARTSRATKTKASRSTKAKTTQKTPVRKSTKKKR